MNVLLVANDKKDVDLSFTKEVEKYLKEKNVNIYYDYKLMLDTEGLNKIKEKDLKSMDFALIIGGDGTVLKYAFKYGEYDFPFVAINFGRVGALADIEADEYKKYIDKILNKDYYIEERMGLECSIYSDGYCGSVEFVGYNDIILHRSLSMKLLPIIIGVNDSQKDLFYADGIVVATPSGSSAYNVSAGGPLLSLSSNVYVITPICPQSKSFTSLVVGENDTISLAIADNANVDINEVAISIDGQGPYFIEKNEKIRISKAKTSLKMIKFNESVSAYKTVHKAVVSIEKKGEKYSV